MSNWWYTCKGCGKTYNRGYYGIGDHTECEMDLLRINRSPIDITRKQWERKRKSISPIIMERDGHKCINCDTETNLTIDHVIPIHLGGSNEIANLQTMCLSCNIKKGIKQNG
jgi:5-methylcytosine-specific restriction protein A